MPDAGHAQGNTAEMKFEKGLLSDTGALNTDQTIRDGLTDEMRSFMDKGGDDFFNDEGPRQNLIPKIRETILKRMIKENEDSRYDAAITRNKHDEFTKKKMMPLIDSFKKTKRDFVIAEAEYDRELIRAKKPSLSGKYDDRGDSLAAPRVRLLSGRPEEDEGSESSEAFSSGDKEPEDTSSVETGLSPDIEGSTGMASTTRTASTTGIGLVDDTSSEEAEEEAVADMPAPPVTAIDAKEKAEDDKKLAEIREKIAIYQNRRRKGHFSDLGLFHFRRAYERAASSYRQDRAALGIQLAKLSTEWDNIRKARRISTFRVHYNKYDKYATAFYKFTRELEGLTTRKIGQIGNKDASKKIAEYTGQYNANQLAGIADEIDRNPYKRFELERVKSHKDLDADSFNEESGDGLFKYHKTIVMTAFEGGVHTLAEEQAAGTKRIRMKMLSDFHGYRAKNQFTSRTDRTALDVGTDARKRALKQDPDAQNTDAQSLNLVADERGKNGEYLESEKSAYMHQVVTDSRRNVYAFYSDGELYSENFAVMRGKDQILHSVNAEKIENDESLRLAIRRSDFFRHINAGTIQYYMAYNPDDDFHFADSMQALQGQANGGQGGDGTPSFKAMMTVQRYLLNAATVADVNAAVTDAGKNDDIENVRNLGITLLSDDNHPELWDCARTLAQNTWGKFGGQGRFRHRLQSLPKSGQVMRIALIEEFAKDRSIADMGWNALFDLRTAILPDNVNMHFEDLSAKRDSTFSLTNFRQSLVDGTIVRALSGTASAVSSGISIRDPQDAWASYTKHFAILSQRVGGGAVGAAVGLSVPVSNIVDSNSPGSDIAGAITSAISAVMDLVKIWRIYKKNQDIADPYTRDQNKMEIGKLVLKAIFDIVDCIVSIVSAVVDKMPAAVSGIVGAIKNFVAIVKDVCILIKTGAEKSRITESDKDMETALTAHRNNLQGQSEKEMLGTAVENSSYGKHFLSLARKRANKEQRNAGFDIATNSVDLVGNGLVAGGAAPWGVGFKLGAKVVSFLGWCVGKKYDASNMDEMIGAALGDKKFASSHFYDIDGVLKRETGIANRHYLMDLSRIFMSIDTHHLVHSPNLDPGETALAINLMRPVLDLVGSGERAYTDRQNKASNIARMQSATLKRIMGAVGAPGNWRAVLRQSISG